MLVTPATGMFGNPVPRPPAGAGSCAQHITGIEERRVRSEIYLPATDWKRERMIDPGRVVAARAKSITEKQGSENETCPDFKKSEHAPAGLSESPEFYRVPCN
jgi:hypothetical protein